ncbi:uncharacterized protein Nmag_1431 [Natrialba magadii ATCC 43099]|uniref:Uncharacterized protein n=1 Tax=Natrialba magadii (strain ATCC 43099 / DSM 3394 / CCM 3739 / CIP 104546 / IAM 13178 / JCM 8861 / NBRC 102185 / NCIMB 2190 / MS3) TaxID=547559 RepID=D3STJ3_NATMM|nr:hypothetical protein [Natrialba magadii]ADD05010.1 uncharacterized protein Nmag_1431 [Natrialba magadii ATCC 43099]ELY23384.1 hypothetical protein C500_19679 [Natrialba magadii ATCC 43099]
MISQAWSDRIHRVRLFLGEHPALRWFALPLIFMGAVITALLLLASDVTVVEAGQVTGLFLLASAGVVALGLGTERALRAVFA